MIYRTARGFHLFPRRYPGVPGSPTDLWVWLFWAKPVPRNKGGK